jgi:alginate O-acetyltransferase complex protein AlgI
MVFSSIVFLFYFLPVFFLLYYLADKKYKNLIILLGSIFFYAWGAPKFIFILLGTTLVDFFVVRQIDRQENATGRKLLLLLSLSINLGLLFYFKYCNFFVDNINFLLAKMGMSAVGWTSGVMPIGISFYTFETLTYVVDVYRRVHKPLRNFWDYQLYIILFPKLIAGPIIRFHDFADQIYDHNDHENADNILRGIYRFMMGLGKKVLIANPMAFAATHIFTIAPDILGTQLAWYGAISYTMQIYFDFSGYSDMAIGLGLMMGFRIPENFNNPYTSTSITDFWRRWHISLGNWMRTYLYIPLGGNRVGSKWRLYFNLWIVFLLSGLWHGAAWGFVVWGAYHGCFLVIERIFLGKWLKKMGLFSVLYSFVVVAVGWVFFRLEDLKASGEYLKRMFSWHPDNCIWVPSSTYNIMMVVALVFSFFTLTAFGRKIQQRVFEKDFGIGGHTAMALLAIVLFIVCGARITVSTFNPFIYFRF